MVSFNFLSGLLAVTSLVTAFLALTRTSLAVAT